MDRLTRRTGFPPEIGVFAVVGAAALPLGRLFRDAGPGQLDVGTVQLASLLLSLAIAWGLRRLHIPVLVSALATSAAFLWFAGAVFHPATLLGPLPTPATLSAVLRTLQEGLRAVSTEVVPVNPAPSFLALVSLGVWGTVWLVDDAAIRLRHPLLAIGLTIPIFAMPGTLSRGSHQWIGVSIYLASALLLLFQDERHRLARWAGGRSSFGRMGPASRIGIAVIALGILLAPVLPGYGQQPGGNLRQAGGPGARLTVDPLVSVRPSLSENPIADLFSVRSNEPLYWRLTSLDRYNGEAWSARKERASISFSGDVKRTSPGAVERVTQEVTIANLAGPWVPAAFEPIGVRDIKGVRLTPESRTLVLGGFKTGQRFTVVSDVPSPKTSDLIADNGTDPEGAAFLDLPSSTPTQIRDIALQIVSRATTKLERAVALQEYLRTFRYDEKIALHHGFSDLLTFLTTVRAGYCEQFAAAMAVMARSIGIPARVAVGFGTGDPGDVAGVYNVTSRQAHAWVEIHFPAYGWVTFEPTPRTDGGFAPPSYARPLVNPGASASPRATRPSASPSPTASATTSRDRGENPQIAKPAGSRSTALPVAVGGVFLAILAAFPGIAFVRRTLRRRRAATPREAIGIRYIEFLEWCRTTSLPRGPGETPLEHAARLSTRAAAASEPLDGLARAATEAVFASETSIEPSQVEDLARDARKRIAPTVTRAKRALPVIGWGWWRRTPTTAGRAPTSRRDRSRV